jgi:hypothetical protein
MTVQDRHSGPTAGSRSAFDRALELHDLDEAVQAYASRSGAPGSSDYWAAWLRFRTQIRTTEDLRRLRTSRRLRISGSHSG